MLQVEALEVLKTGVNVFLTGVPGAGKTYVINQYINWLTHRGIYPAITASTGIAATHVGGMTLHSFSGIGIEKNIDQYKIESIMEREKLVKRIQATKVLIIDEISMLDAQTLDNVNKVLKAIKNPDKPFGGVQIIFVGDFFQLPPVTRQGEYKNYAFAAQAWKEAKLLTCYLEEQFRQTDETFTKLLLAIRENNIDEMHIEILDNLVKKTNDKFGILPAKSSGGESEYEEEVSVNILDDLNLNINLTSDKKYEFKEDSEQEIVDILELHSHNKNVDEINNLKLNLIKEKEYKYEMITQGRPSIIEGLIKNCLSPQVLKLKKGAKIIFTKNSLEGDYVNGTLGHVHELTSYSIKIKTMEGKYVNVEITDWKIEEDGKLKAKISQYPLRLAWAITVHKSQGMSLDEAVISLGDTFEYGQGYVALSRVRSLEGLYLKNYNAKSLQINASISEFDEKIRKDSRFIQGKFQKSDKEKLEQTQKNFVENAGGKFEGEVEPRERFTQKSIQKSTREITLELIKSGKNIEEISVVRDIKVKSLTEHVEELYKEKKLTKLEIEKLVPKSINIFNIPNDIKKSFKKRENMKDERDSENKIKLAGVFKDTKEKYSYDDLRWYRLFVEDF